MNKNSLNMSTFLLNAGNLKEQLQELTIAATNKTVDAKGIADRYAYNQVVKQAQKITLAKHWYNGDTLQEAVNLDISAWGIGGDLLAELKSGSIRVTTNVQDASGAAMAYEVPVPIGTDVEVTSSHMISTNASLVEVAMLGVIADFDITAGISFAGEDFSAPMVLSAASHKIVRGELQMEDVSLKLKGTPTDPATDGSLLYLCMLGSAAISMSSNTGANTYATGEDQFVTIAEYNLDFRDADLIKEQVTLLAQGALALS